MNCERIQPLLSLWIDGDLAAGEREEVDRHLESCLTCRREMLSLRAVVDGGRELPRGIDPGRDLWPGIEARLHSGSRPPSAEAHWSSRRGWLAAAAVLLLLVTLPLVRGLERRWQAPDPAIVPVAERDLVEAAMPASTILAQAGLARSEDGTLHSRTDLEVTVERRRDVLSEEVVDDLEENLRILDVAVAELRSALDEDPWNRRLSHLLAARYQQEAELAQRMNRI